jgi:hypothetical protein
MQAEAEHRAAAHTTASQVDEALAQLEQRHGDALIDPKTSEAAPPTETGRLHQLMASRPRTQAEHEQLKREQARRASARAREPMSRLRRRRTSSGGRRWSTAPTALGLTSF